MATWVYDKIRRMLSITDGDNTTDIFPIHVTVSNTSVHILYLHLLSENDHTVGATWKIHKLLVDDYMRTDNTLVREQIYALRDGFTPIPKSLII